MMDEAEEIARNAAGIFLGVTSFRALSGYLLWRAIMPCSTPQALGIFGYDGLCRICGVGN